jgi:hypothetical protein
MLRTVRKTIFPFGLEEGSRWVKAVELFIEEHVKELEDWGFKKADIEAQPKFINKRIAYWNKQEKERKIPQAEFG